MLLTRRTVDQAQGLPDASRRAIDETIAETALRLERTLAVARLLFFGAVLVRFLWIAELPLPGLLITTIPLVGGLLFSTYVLLFVRQAPRGEGLWVVSVVVDSIAVLGSLLPNALYPTAEYGGTLNVPDTGGMLVATFSAGLRLSPRAAAIGGGANVLSLVTLLLSDRVVSGLRYATALPRLSVSMIFVVACGALAVVLAATTRRLVRHAALVALRADRAEQGLGTVLAEHHDLSSLLASTMVSADLLARKLEGRPGAAELARELTEDLHQVREAVAEVKARAISDLSAFGELSAVEVRPVVRRVARQARARFEAVLVDLEAVEPGRLAQVVGGAPTLHRILLNLVTNACEGDGVTSPSRVHLATRLDQALGVLVVVVEDDGVGLSAELLGGAVGSSGKPGGSGLGLAVVKGLTEASGGSVRIENRASGGARATVTLPLA